MSGFKKATRAKAKLRLAIDGPPGSGKSFTALRFAFAFPGARVACIEAGENGGLSLYLGDSPDGVPFEFDIFEMSKNFAPSEYAAAINEAGRGGYDVLVIDSLSHAWSGAGGALDQVGNSSFTANDGWKKVTPQHNKMIDAILQSPCHVIATLRSKVEYVVEENDRGKKEPKKVGMAPIQRQGMEYEFTLYGSMDYGHNLQITKSRCAAMQDALAHKPGAEFVRPLIEWLDTGKASSRFVGVEQAGRIVDAGKALGFTREAIEARMREKYGLVGLADLTPVQADEVEAALVTAKADKQKPKGAPIEYIDAGPNGHHTQNAPPPACDESQAPNAISDTKVVTTYIDPARVEALGKMAGSLNQAKFSARLMELYGVERLAQLSPAQADEVQAGLEKMAAAKAQPKAEPPPGAWARAFEAKLVGEGVTMPGRLMESLADEFGTPPESWPATAAQAVRAACRAFEEMSRSVIAGAVEEEVPA